MRSEGGRGGRPRTRRLDWEVGLKAGECRMGVRWERGGEVGVGVEVQGGVRVEVMEVMVEVVEVGVMGEVGVLRTWKVRRSNGSCK
jgi:hypothetical protein